VLAAGKGWVLAILAMLAPKWALRVAPGGSGPGAKRRRPCPLLRAVAAGWRRDERRPTHRRQEGLTARHRTKGLGGKKSGKRRSLLPTMAAA
jgi:hypothetical protein